MSGDESVLTFLFEDAGDIPNNPNLRLVVFKRAVTLERLADSDADKLARAFEERFPRGGWRAAWRWGVYDFPHYHSTAHEVLGCFRGTATIRFGHTKGVTLSIEPGDVAIIPAGVGHQNLGSSADFQVVGGYPEKQDADLLRVDASDSARQAARENIARVPLPSGDPIFGPHGPLAKHWNLGIARDG